MISVVTKDKKKDTELLSDSNTFRYLKVQQLPKKSTHDFFKILTFNYLLKLYSKLRYSYFSFRISSEVPTVP